MRLVARDLQREELPFQDRLDVEVDTWMIYAYLMLVVYLEFTDAWRSIMIYRSTFSWSIYHPTRLRMMLISFPEGPWNSGRRVLQSEGLMHRTTTWFLDSESEAPDAKSLPLPNLKPPSQVAWGLQTMHLTQPCLRPTKGNIANSSPPPPTKMELHL